MTRTRSNVRGADLREELVRYGRHLLESRGIEAVQLKYLGAGFPGRGLADRKKGVSRAGVYYHFKSKSELLEAIARSALADLRDAIVREAGSGGSPIDILERMSSAYVYFAEKNRFTYGLINSRVFSPGHASEIGIRADPGMLMMEIRNEFSKVCDQAGLPIGRAWTFFLAMHAMASLHASWLDDAWPSLAKQFGLANVAASERKAALLKSLLRSLL